MIFNGIEIKRTLQRALDKYLRKAIHMHRDRYDEEEMYARLAGRKVKVKILNSRVHKRSHTLVCIMEIPKFPGAFNYTQKEWKT